MAVLVDSSVWIAAASPKAKEKNILVAMIEKQELICITKLIQIEVCQGSRSEELFRRLWDSFLGFNFLDVHEDHWDRSAWNFFKCKKKGITVTTIDCLIATLAHDYQVPLWTLDKDFKFMQPVIGFDIFN